MFYFATYLPILCNYFSIGSILALSVSTTRSIQFLSRQSVLETQYTDRLVLSRYLLPLIGTKCAEHHAFVFLHDSKAYTCASRHGDSSAAAAENVTVQFTPMQTGIRLNIVPDASVTKQGAATPCGWEGNRRFWHRTGAQHWPQTPVTPTGWAQGLRDMIWHTLRFVYSTRTELNRDDLQLVDPVTRRVRWSRASTSRLDWLQRN